MDSSSGAAWTVLRMPPSSPFLTSASWELSVLCGFPCPNDPSTENEYSSKRLLQGAVLRILNMDKVSTKCQKYRPCKKQDRRGLAWKARDRPSIFFTEIHGSYPLSLISWANSHFHELFASFSPFFLFTVSFYY